MDLHSSLPVGLSVEGGESAAAPDPLAACWLVQRREAEACLSAQDVRRLGEPGPAHRGETQLVQHRGRVLWPSCQHLSRALPQEGGAAVNTHRTQYVPIFIPSDSHTVTHFSPCNKYKSRK